MERKSYSLARSFSSVLGSAAVCVLAGRGRFSRCRFCCTNMFVCVIATGTSAGWRRTTACVRHRKETGV